MTSKIKLRKLKKNIINYSVEFTQCKLVSAQKNNSQFMMINLVVILHLIYKIETKITCADNPKSTSSIERFHSTMYL